MNAITRQNIDHLTPTELAQLRAGYAGMQALSDNRGFNAIAGYHKVPLNLCYHHEDPTMFLPWHRGYMLTFEQFLRDQGSQLALPYWDWTSPTSHAKGVPAAFGAPSQPNGKPNPLYRSMINAPTVKPPVNRWTKRFPGNPKNLPTLTSVQAVLAIADYPTFCGQLQDIHDAVHVWTGGAKGDMAFLDFAAYDPIFYSHHCMIDRIWDRWQQLHGITNIKPNLLQRPLRGFDNLTVASVLDTSELGYSYASDEIVLNEKT
jgi:tyrosinase